LSGPGGPLIAVVDYGMGNRRSVEKALAHVGARATVSAEPAVLRSAEGLVLPGVGAFPRAMANLRELSLDELLRERMAEGVPLLGLCLGMQLLFESSTELGGASGLGFLRGTVDRLETGGLKLPHIGWNRVTWRRSSELTSGLPAQCAFYHVHTFVPRPAEQQDLLGTGDYGGDFASAVAHPERPLYGVQFHPEKSSGHGLRLLGNFAAVCARVTA